MTSRSSESSNASRSFGSLRQRRVARGVLLPRALAVADVEREALVAERGALGEMDRVVALDRDDVDRLQALGHVDVARAQVGRAHRALGDDLERDLAQRDAVGVVVVRRALEHDAVGGDALLVLERPDAHRVAAELVAEAVERLRGHDHPRAVGQQRGQRREALGEPQAHRVVVDDLDRPSRARARRSGWRPRACGGGRATCLTAAASNGVPSLNSDALAQPDRDRLAVAGSPSAARTASCGRTLSPSPMS